jgi:hypothetical protein
MVRRKVSGFEKVSDGDLLGIGLGIEVDGVKGGTDHKKLRHKWPFWGYVAIYEANIN